MIQIKWVADDGKTRPSMGMPKVGETYTIADKLAHSYVAQNMASYVDAKDGPTIKKSPKKLEEK